jgi:hypothetical protein
LDQGYQDLVDDVDDFGSGRWFTGEKKCLDDEGGAGPGYQRTRRESRRLTHREAVAGQPERCSVCCSPALVSRRSCWRNTPDFLRDYRGDTVHRSTIEVLAELGLADRFLALPHRKVPTIGVHP